MLKSFGELLPHGSSKDQFLEIASFIEGTGAQPCGRRLTRGGIFYSCKTCAVGSNLVFCNDCFDFANHKEHDLSLSESQQTGVHRFCHGPLSLKYLELFLPHSAQSEIDSKKVHMLPEVISLLRNIAFELIGNLACAFDLSPRGSKESWIVLLYSEKCSFSQNWASSIVKVLGIPQSQGESMAGLLKTSGRISIFKSESQELAQTKATQFSKRTFKVRVISEEQYNQESLAFQSLQTLLKMCEFPAIVEMISQALFCPLSSLGSKINIESSLVSEFLTPKQVKMHELLVADFFLLFGNVLWKEFKQLLLQLLNVSLLSPASNYKIEFSKKFVLCYKRLYAIYQLDRENWVHMFDFTVDLLRDSANAALVCRETLLLSDILDCIFDSCKISPDGTFTESFSDLLRNPGFLPLFEHLLKFTIHESAVLAITPPLKDRLLQLLALFEQILESQYTVRTIIGRKPGCFGRLISKSLSEIAKNISRCFTIQDLPLIIEYYSKIPITEPPNVSIYHPLTWLVGAIVSQNCAPLPPFDKLVIAGLEAMAKKCLDVHIQLADFESRVVVFADLHSFYEALAYFNDSNYECMHAQDWNLIKFATQKYSIPISIASVKFENSRQLRDILVLIARLICKIDHNSPRIFLMHVLAEGPMTMNELLRKLPTFVSDNNEQKLVLLLEELAELGENKYYLKPCFFDQIDIFYYSLYWRKSTNNIIQNARKNGVNVFLNDIPCETSFCIQMLIELEQRLALVRMDDCSDTIKALVLRIRKQIPNYAQSIIERLPKNLPVIQGTVAPASHFTCCPV